jgi:hypothetical protein
MQKGVPLSKEVIALGSEREVYLIRDNSLRDAQSDFYNYLMHNGFSHDELGLGGGFWEIGAVYVNTHSRQFSYATPTIGYKYKRELSMEEFKNMLEQGGITNG